MRVLAAAAVVAVLLALSGGFGSDALTIAPRIAYWMALSFIGVAVGAVAQRWLVPRAWMDERPLAAGGLMAVCITAPMTLIVATQRVWISHQAFRAADLARVFPTTLAITLAMTALALLVRRRGPVATHAAAAGEPRAKFLARLPPKLEGARLWAVEAQDHYLRLHTSKGEDLILMRLGDAIAELKGIEGARTHRSWWVCREAVTSAVRAEGRATLTLIGGTRVPVSRGYARSLREAGWF
jgi:DNA-binding LytR/AlgR family response regulator